jgi:5-methylcytosine-specific restriction endonuclease McrA
VSIPDLVRAMVYARNEFRCVRCGTSENLSLDHIQPRADGGTDSMDNLQTLCRPCNSRKGRTSTDRAARQFVAFRIEAALLDAVDALALDQGCSRSAMFRNLIESGLQREASRQKKGK